MSKLPQPARQINADMVGAVRSGAMQASNVRNATALTVVDRYVEWTLNTERTLWPYFTPSSLTTMLRTPVYWMAVSSTARAASATTGTVMAELDAMIVLLDQLATKLSAFIDRWDQVNDLVVLDTDVWTHHRPPVEQADWNAIANIRRGRLIHLVVPMLVVDQLDRAKDKRTGKGELRVRPRDVLKLLRDAFHQRPDLPFGLGEEVNGMHAVSLELLVDELDHERLPHEDSELIERCLWLKTVSGLHVVFITGDTGAYLRARAAGLEAIHLDMPDDPPAQATKSPR